MKVPDALRWRDVRRIFDAAVELTPDLRKAFLDAARLATDLRREVELLLENDALARESDLDFLPGSDRFSHAGWQEGDPTEAPAIEGYRIERPLAPGGQSTVFLARPEGREDPVAIKVLPAAATASMLQRFRQECRVLASLDHPGIVRVLEAGSTKNRMLFLVMERVDGVPIDGWLRASPRSFAERAELIARVLDVLEYAHARGVVHRDLKPSNVLVDAQGSPKLLDFGIARIGARDERRTRLRTATGHLVGTFAYMSPEQADGRSALVGPATDVYQCAVLLFEMITGRIPYEAEERSTMALLRAILFEPRIPILHLAPGLGPALGQLIDSALAIDVAQRPRSAHEFARALRAAIERDAKV